MSLSRCINYWNFKSTARQLKSLPFSSVPCQQDAPSSSTIGESNRENSTAILEELWPNRIDHLSALYPSAAFLCRLSETGRRRVKKLIEELELYCHLSDKYPRELTDERWDQLIRMPSLRLRVVHLQFLADENQKHQRKMLAKAENQAEFSKKRDQEFAEKTARLEAGEMAYGSEPLLHRLVENPSRREQRRVHGARVLSVLRDSLYPDILIDMQAMKFALPAERAKIDRQIQQAYTEYYDARLPAFFRLVNFDEATLSDMRKRNICTISSQPQQMLEPEVTAKSVKDLYPNRNDVICIDPDAHYWLSGPLTAKAYVILATDNRQKQCTGTFLKDNLIIRRLPIDELMRWKRGGHNLPLNRTIRILRDVALTGGDWKTALEMNILNRQTTPDSELTFHERELAYSRREAKAEREDIIRRLAKTVWNEAIDF